MLGLCALWGPGGLDQNGWAMTERQTVEATGPRCQARPAAARRGWREDVLCASHANTSVDFHGVAMPVCGMHEKAYAHWGSDAEQHAEALWGWLPSGSPAEPEERRRHDRRDGLDRRVISRRTAARPA
jgi:hypothetical protein